MLRFCAASPETCKGMMSLCMNTGYPHRRTALCHKVNVSEWGASPGCLPQEAGCCQWYLIFGTEEQLGERKLRACSRSSVFSLWKGCFISEPFWWRCGTSTFSTGWWISIWSALVIVSPNCTRKVFVVFFLTLWHIFALIYFSLFTTAFFVVKTSKKLTLTTVMHFACFCTRVPCHQITTWFLHSVEFCSIAFVLWRAEKRTRIVIAGQEFWELSFGKEDRLTQLQKKAVGGQIKARAWRLDDMRSDWEHDVCPQRDRMSPITFWARLKPILTQMQSFAKGEKSAGAFAQTANEQIWDEEKRTKVCVAKWKWGAIYGLVRNKRCWWMSPLNLQVKHQSAVFRSRDCGMWPFLPKVWPVWWLREDADAWFERLEHKDLYLLELVSSTSARRHLQPHLSQPYAEPSQVPALRLNFTPFPVTKKEIWIPRWA